MGIYTPAGGYTASQGHLEGKTSQAGLAQSVPGQVVSLDTIYFPQLDPYPSLNKMAGVHDRGYKTCL